MSPTTPKSNNKNQPSLAVRIGQALRRYFLAGLATLVPVVVTIGILVWLFTRADQLLGRYFEIPGLGLVVTVLLVLAVGVFSSLFGRVVVRVIEVWFNRLPIVRKIYPAVKQLSQFLFGEQSSEKKFRRAVLVEYPRKGSYSIGFVTNQVEMKSPRLPKKMLTILIPQPPSPVTGPIIFVPEEDAIAIDVSVEDAVKLIMSGGIIAPPLQGPAAAPSS